MRINVHQTKWLDNYRSNFIIAFIMLIAMPQLASGQTPTSEDILTKSIAYHDPDGMWSSQQQIISLAEKRPNGNVRETKLTIDLGKEYFQMDQIRDNHRIVSDIRAGAVQIKIDGQPPTDTALIKKYRLEGKRMLLMRDYYTYLYGLPMKLRDPGTLIDPEVQDTTFQDEPVFGLKITYTPEVGKDVWYFYFDKNNFALRGYRFYHNESANDGEYIILDGEARHQSLKLPKSRKWFTHKEDKFLGEDIIVNIQ